MLGSGDEAGHKFTGRPRLDRADLASMMNPASRQIYLTFPADSTSGVPCTPPMRWIRR
jgi:hypothetical protein